MDLTAFLPLVLLCVAVQGHENITAWYGKTITVPCNGGKVPVDGLVFVKWKYAKDDGTPGDLLIKQSTSDQVTILASEEYASRISMEKDFSLLISQASLRDQRIFTCMAVSPSNVNEYSVNVEVKKKPSSVEIIDKPEALKKDILTTVGTCIVKDSNPAATITWTKNKSTLNADGKGVFITPSVKVDPATGLSTSHSTLQYVAAKEDGGAVFTCVSTYEGIHNETNLEPLAVHYPSERVRLDIVSKTPIVEGANVTLKCAGDGNPPPNSFFFHKKGTKTRVEKTDIFTLTLVSKEDTGLYKCSLPENEKLKASQNITVHYVHLDLSPSGRVVKMIRDPFSIKIDLNTSVDPQIVWTKDGNLVSQPEFLRLHYGDAGSYSCKVSIPGLTVKKSVELVVEGIPVITNLTQNNDELKVLTCEAEGAPQPQFKWSINGTVIKTSYTKGKAIEIFSISDTNLLVACNVSNKLGDDVRTINVTSENASKEEHLNDSTNTSTIVMVVLILFVLAVAVLGIGYCLYTKSRAGEFSPVPGNETQNVQTPPDSSNHTA
ncbi:CD166 antigen homolog [Oryzias latipes]